MEQRLIIPKKLKVGFNERSDTYGGFLAFITYYRGDEIVAEKAWKDWIEGRGKSYHYEGNERQRKETMGDAWTPMPIIDAPNTPTSGFVFNKRTGGYTHDFGMRDSVLRIYDPRGFEFEITPEELTFIVMNNGIHKGGELQGEFVYVWSPSGGNVQLMPVDCANYEDAQYFTDASQKKITKRGMVIGNQYRDLYGCEYIYLGDKHIFDNRYDYIPKPGRDEDRDDTIQKHYQKKYKELIFKKVNVDKPENYSFETMKNTKDLKFDLGPSNEDVNVLMGEYVQNNIIGEYDGFKVEDIGIEHIQSINEGHIHKVFKIENGKYIAYNLSTTYKKWGQEWKHLNICKSKNLEIIDYGDHYTIEDLVSSYYSNTYYRNRKPQLKLYNSDEEFLNEGFKTITIKHTFGKNITL